MLGQHQMIRFILGMLTIIAGVAAVEGTAGIFVGGMTVLAGS